LPFIYAFLFYLLAMLNISPVNLGKT